jgi:translation initiation factor IF-1
MEKYAIVRKFFGGSICDVLCHDNISRHAIIRGKFSGKNKRKNIITNGTILLVGLRDWSSSHFDSLDKCDILEVYSLHELDLLKQRPDFPTHLFTSITSITYTDTFQFSTFDDFTPISTTDTLNITLNEIEIENENLLDSSGRISFEDI